MNSEGRHWSDPDCVLCSWVPHLDTGEDDTTDRICSRCCEYDMASTAHRVREPRAFCLKQAKACEARARSGTEKDIAPFSRLMWERTALHWRLAAFRGFRWIPNTRTVAVLFPRMTAEVQPASAAQRRSEARPPDRRATLCSPGQLRRTAGAVRTPGRLPQPHIVPTQHPLAPPATSSRPSTPWHRPPHRPDVLREGRCAVLGRCVLTAPAVRRRCREGRCAVRRRCREAREAVRCPGTPRRLRHTVV